ncbi:TPA: hypothetical protein KRE82_003602 [Clostridioides difficile]|nr:hypothetical protein [Clostridioides difficile]
MISKTEKELIIFKWLNLINEEQYKDKWKDFVIMFGDDGILINLCSLDTIIDKDSTVYSEIIFEQICKLDITNTDELFILPYGFNKFALIDNKTCKKYDFEIDTDIDLLKSKEECYYVVCSVLHTLKRLNVKINKVSFGISETYLYLDNLIEEIKNNKI